MKRPLLAGVTILVTWMLVDLLIHRVVLARAYDAAPHLWRPVDEMNVPLIYTATLILIAVFVGTYTLLVRPKSLAAGLGLGAFVGLALGIAVGLGTFIHMPIPPAVAWGWFVAGWLKGLIAGAVLGVVLTDA
jgi:hypothetical protein